MSRHTSSLQHIAPCDWPSVLARFDDAGYQQCLAYARALAGRDGSSPELLALVDDRGAAISAACVRTRRLPVLGGGIAYVAGGPLVCTDGRSDDESLLNMERMLRLLLDEYVGQQGCTLRVAPPPRDPAWNQRVNEHCTTLGLSVSTQAAGYRTFLVNLEPPLDELHRGLKRKWRNHLTQARKHEFVVQAGTDDALFGQFQQLYQQLRRRKNFHVELDAAFYAAVQRALAPDEKLIVSIASHHGTPVAGHVAAAHGDRCIYLLGAANETGLKLKATHLLQWSALESARRRGQRFYDLGGVDPDDNPGVYDFKKGLGGREVHAPGPFERRTTGFRAVVTNTAERLYRKLHRAA